MNIIIEFILRTIQEKKLRTALIIFSIAISVALFFASIAISSTIESIYTENLKKDFGAADILISAQTTENTPFFRFAADAIPLEIGKNITHMWYAIKTNGIYTSGNETVPVTIKGTELNALTAYNPFILKQGSIDQQFEGKKMIINTVDAAAYHLRIGDTVDIEIYGTRYPFTISGIAEPTGPFQFDPNMITAVIPIDFLDKINNARGRYTDLYMQLNEKKKKQEVIASLQHIQRELIVKETINKEEIRSYSQGITIPFMMMSLIALFLSTYIIYTSFKVITSERLPVIGTFRSIGATKKTTDLVLFIESSTYGITGSALGLLLGIGVLFCMTFLLFQGSTSINFTPAQLIISFFLGILLSFLSALFPIMAVSRYPIKEIVLNTIEQTVTNTKSPLLGGVFLAVSIIMPFFLPDPIAFVGELICMLLFFVALILLTPSLTAFFASVFENIYLPLFGAIGTLAVKNLRGNKNIFNNIILLAIGLASLLTINSVSFSVVTELTNFFRDARFEIWVIKKEATRNTRLFIENIPGVQNTYGLYAIKNVEIRYNGIKNKTHMGFKQFNPAGQKFPAASQPAAQTGSHDYIKLLQGIDPGTFQNFWDLGIPPELLGTLTEQRTILLTETLKEKFRLKTGDRITVTTEHGDKSYQIIGFFTSLRGGGNYGLIAEKYLREDFNQIYYQEIYVKTSGDIHQIQKAIKDKFARNTPFVTTIASMEKNQKEANQRLFAILQGFSLFSLFISIFGILNNITLSFIERKRSLAVMRSVGMNKKQIIIMMFIESLTSGIIGSSAGLCAGGVLTMIIQKVIETLGISIRISIDPALILFSFIAGIIITVAASVGPALQSSKMSIIESIKYE